MFCDECHENIPCVYLIKVVNGKVFKTHLCEECAKKFWDNSLSFDEFFEFPQSLSEIFDLEKGVFPEELEREEMVCSNCGMKLSDFYKNGRLGCSECYKMFDGKLSCLLNKIHGSGEHVGKIPMLLNEITRLELRLTELHRQLKLYVGEEKYEKAAKVRDEIKDLESQVSLEVG